MCFGFTDYAQVPAYNTLTAYTANFTRKTTPDTMVNTDSSYLVANTMDYRNFDLNFVYTLTKVSGTISGGTVVFQGTNDDSQWWTLKSSAIQSVETADTVTLTNASITKQFNILQSQYSHVRARFIPTGTQTSVANGKVYYTPRKVKIMP